MAFGPELDGALCSLTPPPTAEQWRLLRDLVALCRSDLRPAAAFAPGDVVCHARYGYRGVVVHATPCFDGDEEWYRRAQTQPDKNQPWYHVLVHNTGQVTYAAQTSLEADGSGEAVSHPYIPFFFADFADGRYLRNERPWPE
ncbi:MAG: heat shock protein HspQ [Nitrospirae bacterium]|nr:heat shock protein HspQ [Nitrospirota bacterium]